MTMNLRLITPPSEDPISLEEAKAHLNVDADITEDDNLIRGLIAAAVQAAEHKIGRSLMPQTWELTLDRFVPVITLDKPPIVQVKSVRYMDPDGVMQTLASAAYLLDDFSEPGRLVPAPGMFWPETRCQLNAVRIQFEVGYEDAAKVPRAIKQWMLLQIGTMYANRESAVIGTIVAELPHVDGLLDRYKVWR